jgi:methylmalonyl-CoA/ethylmalonyl-CoA epimerase
MSSPKNAPAFSKTMQIGIVVPDVEAAVRTYQDVYGIGGWQIMEIGSENAEDVRLHGRPVEWKSKIAVTIVGSVMWELIQPIDENDLFGRFLAERGGVGGVHHIAVSTPDYQRVVREQMARGNGPILSGTFSGVEVQYLDTERELGVILEVFSHMPEGIELPSG